MNRRCPGSPSIIACIVLVVLAGAIGAAAQTTINVPADVATIQAAINAARNGDTVLVAPGTYLENISFQGKAITLVSANGADTTIIDGGGIATVVTFNHGETANAVLSGFTIRNGSSTMSGGGIKITNASPTIRANVISGNHAIYGIGIDVNGGSPLIEKNVITDNHQCCGTSGFGGGGVSIQGGSATPAAPRITGNTITNNSVSGGGFGGGIDITYYAAPLIENNYIAGNSAYNYGGGINVSSYSQALVVQNIVTGNFAGAGGSGGGVAFYAGGAASLLLNNTLYGNLAYNGSAEIFLSSYSSAVVVTNNAVLATAGDALTCDVNAQPTVSHNVIYSLSGSAYAGNCRPMLGTNGNLAADPLFVNASGGDFHLQAKSPAVDAGDSSALSLPNVDYDGKSRVVDGNGDGSIIVDAGAYEYNRGPIANISPAALAFGDQNLYTYSAPQTATLTNTGTADLTINSTQQDGPFLMTTTCGPTLAPGASCALTISFAPQARGAATGTVTVFTDAPGTPPTVALSGTGVAPVLALSSSSLSFGDVLVGTTSATLPLVLSNTGDGTLFFTGLNITGATQFAAGGNCASSLAPGANCTMNVSFSPTARGPVPASYGIGVGVPASSQNVALYGVGIAPVLSVTPVALGFGSQRLNTTSVAQTITISNTGDAALNVWSITSGVEFPVLRTCVGPLAPGAACSMAVAFSPAALGLRSGTVIINDDAPGAPHTIPLSGYGVDFALAVGSITLPRGASAGTMYTVSAVGGSYPYPVDLSCSGLPRGTSCSFDLNTVAPGANGATGTVTISTSKNTLTGTYELAITGVSATQQHTVTLILSVTK